MHDLIVSVSAMGKFMKSGKVVLVLGGRFAGRKAVIVKVSIVAFHMINNYHTLALKFPFVE